MELKQLKEVVKNIFSQTVSKKKPDINKVIQNFKLIFFNEENEDDEKNFQQIYKQEFIIINQYVIEGDKYLLICVKNIIFLILSTKLESFISYLGKNANINIIYLSEDALNLLNTCVDQNNIKLFNNNVDYKKIPFYKEEIDQFLSEIPCKRNDKKYFILRSISAFLIQNAHLKIRNKDRIQNYYENTSKEKFFLSEKDYIDLRNLSSGTSSYVKLIYHINQAKLFAMKIITNQDLFEREKNNYLHLRHPFLAKFYGTAKFEAYNCLILEFIEGKTLTMAKTNINMVFNDAKEMIKIIFQMMISFNYLHNINFIIRDIHPNNFLVDLNNKTIVLIDFDRMHEKSNIIFDSMNSEYMSPESMTDNVFTIKSDIYSLGLVLKSFKWSDLKGSDKIDSIKFNEFISQFIQKEPQKRLSLSELIKNFYFSFVSKFQNDLLETDTFNSIDDIGNEKYNEYLIYLAEPENQFSLCELAKLYENGTLFKKDINKAIKYYSRAVYKENKESKTILQNIFNEIKENKQNSFGNLYNFEDWESTIIDSFQNENLRELYKKFNFINYNSKLDLNDFLKDFKFITYNHTILNKTIICVEGLVIVINSNDILNKLDSSKIINVTKNETKSNNDEELATTEVNNFCEFFQDEINKNEFIRLTIRAISAFIIRRFSCHSSFFKDQSYLTYNHSFQSYEYKTKNKLYQIFDSEKMKKQNWKLKSLFQK